MSTLTPDLLAGFLAQAQSYVDSARKLLTRYRENPESEYLTQLHSQVQILGSSTRLLNLSDLSAIAEPAVERLVARINQAQVLEEEDYRRLVDAFDQMEQCIGALQGDPAPSVPPTPAQAPYVAPDIPEELLQIFTVEANEHFEVIQTRLEHLRMNPGDHDALAEVRRVTHTLKGAAASVGFSEMARVAHLVEDLTERQIETGERLSTETVDLLLDSADALESLLLPQESDPRPALDVLDARFAQILGAGHKIQPQEPDRRPHDPVEARPTSHQTENMLRLPLSSIDTLINQVGEIIINRGVSEGHLDLLRGLLNELDHSARRLQRVALDIDVQIETAPQTKSDFQGTEFAAFDPLELDRYSLLHQYTRELEEVASDASDINGRLHLLADDFDANLRTERRLTGQLQENLLGTRLVPFRELETRLRRTVQRTANNLGKSVELTTQGFETEVDKTILNALVDPLTHLLRNAIDHGIEDPAGRAAARKLPVSQLVLTVRRERSRVVISLSDDGRGIDVAQIRQRAVAQGMIPADDSRSSEQLLELLFAEGFSLAETVTETSGRGLGLNIVRRASNQLQGSVHITTILGRGTTFTISVPVTLAITRSLTIRIGDTLMAVPTEQISAVLRLEPQSFEEIRQENVLHHAGQVLSIYDLASFTGDAGSLEARRYGLVIEAGSQNTVVLIDGLAGTSEAVIKSLGNHLRRVYGISGATIAGDGSVVLILDLIELTSGGRPAIHIGEWKHSIQTSHGEQRHALIVDDSLSVRRVVSSFLERMGWQTTLAKDGIDALEKLASVRPDVALVDIEMPRMNGYELLSRIRSDAALHQQELPVVFLTSRSAAKHRDRASQLGVDGYLVKPYREEELIDTLLRAIEEREHAQ